MLVRRPETASRTVGSLCKKAAIAGASGAAESAKARLRHDRRQYAAVRIGAGTICEVDQLSRPGSLSGLRHLLQSAVGAYGAVEPLVVKRAFERG